MSVVKINAITVPRERFDEFARRFAARAGKVEAAGLRGLRAAAPERRARGLPRVTRWRSEEDFRAWVAGPDFAAGHAQHRTEGRSAPPASCGRSTCSRRSERVSERYRRSGRSSVTNTAASRATRTAGSALPEPAEPM